MIKCFYNIFFRLIIISSPRWCDESCSWCIGRRPAAQDEERTQGVHFMIPVWNIYLFSFSGVPACHRKDICSLPLYAQDSDLNLTGYLNTFDRCWYDCLSDLILRFWRGGDCRGQEERLGSGGQQLLDTSCCPPW